MTFRLARRPINPPVTNCNSAGGYTLTTRPTNERDPETLVVLTFSGGGTRAAAFSFGVLEALRRTEITRPDGKRRRLLDEVDIISGVSGGSFTALSYGLHGEGLFDEYEARFLKRNVQRQLLARVGNPANWLPLSTRAWSRSELAAQLYDEILFEGATFGDLQARDGPLIMTSATDISTGARFGFTQGTFDAICSDLSKIHLARAAAASSAVPFLFSPITLNNYGGTCGYEMPAWLVAAADPMHSTRPGARAFKRMEEFAGYLDSKARPYLHVMDGGLADNLGMRSILEALEQLEAVRLRGGRTALDRTRRFVVVVVNSRSTPATTWDQSEAPPSNLAILIKAAGVPIDRYSYETVEVLRDIMARWNLMGRIRDSEAFDAEKDQALASQINAPSAKLYAIDVSLPQLRDKAEFAYLNDLPTSFVLSAEAVDRLRAAAGKILLDSPDFHALLRDVGAKLHP